MWAYFHLQKSQSQYVKSDTDSKPQKGSYVSSPQYCVDNKETDTYLLPNQSWASDASDAYFHITLLQSCPSNMQSQNEEICTDMQVGNSLFTGVFSRIYLDIL